MAAAKEAILTGDTTGLEQSLVGLRIWVDAPGTGDLHAFVHGPYRVLSFHNFLPADRPGADQRRKKHLVQVWTDPGGLRTISIGSIRLKDPRKQR